MGRDPADVKDFEGLQEAILWREFYTEAKRFSMIIQYIRRTYNRVIHTKILTFNFRRPGKLHIQFMYYVS